MSLRSSSMSTLGELFSLWGAGKPAWRSCFSWLKVLIFPVSYVLTRALNSFCFSTVYFSGQRRCRQQCWYSLCSSATFLILAYPSFSPSPLCFEMNCCAGPSRKFSLTKTNGLVLCYSPRVVLVWLEGALPGEHWNKQAGADVPPLL